MIKRCFQRWGMCVELPDALRTQITTATKWSTFTTDDQQTIRAAMIDGRQRDCVVYMHAVIQYYIKHHRFKFSEEVREYLQTPAAEMTFDALHPMYVCTVENMEREQKCFQASLRVRRRTVGGTHTVGPFNCYVRDQWQQRPDELRTICLQTKSTNVMKLLSKEWQGCQETREKYKKTSQDQRET
jgi:hypothetical protein